MQELIIMQGMPASGKSTWAKQWVAEDIEHRIRVNRDDLRSMMTTQYNPEVDKYIKDTERHLTLQLLKHGWSVVVDDTNLKAQDIVDWDAVFNAYIFSMNISSPRNLQLQPTMRFQRMDTPKEECIKRNNGRSIGQVPTGAIESMSQSKYLTCPLDDMIQIAKSEINQ